MCNEAVQAVYELEHMGLPFSRTPDGKIDQRPFGGHTNNKTGKPVRRACFAADRTGHMILQTLYQACIKNKVNFFDEFQVVDLILVNGAAAGVVAIELATGEYHVFHAKAVIFATGGHGRIWEITSNAYAYTGDGVAVTLRRGIPAQDMEFFQFHPTGIYKLGILITEGVRGEGGVLVNDHGERFMGKYAPNVKDLASRDVVSRAMYLEMARGVASKASGTCTWMCAPKWSTSTLPWMGAAARMAPPTPPPLRSCCISCRTSSTFAARTWASIR